MGLMGILSRVPQYVIDVYQVSKTTTHRAKLRIPILGQIQHTDKPEKNSYEYLNMSIFYSAQK